MAAAPKTQGQGQWPWSRRTNIYDPPTVLDRFLASPLQLLVESIYFSLLHLRSSLIPSRKISNPIRIVCISDTHNNLPTVPTGDLLIHCGDLTNGGTRKEIQRELDWLSSLPHPSKIVIAGNHDSWFDIRSRTAADKKSGHELDFHDLHYLEHEALQLEFKGGRKLNFYASPDIPACGGSEMAFQYEREAHTWNNAIPLETDVLITHTPARHVLDLGLGCDGLSKEVWRVKPSLHVFGHIHSGHGQYPLFWDKAQLVYENFMDAPKTGVLADLIPSASWILAGKAIWQSVVATIVVGSTVRRGVAVNAAMVYQSTTKIGNPPEVVEI